MVPSRRSRLYSEAECNITATRPLNSVFPPHAKQWQESRSLADPRQSFHHRNHCQAVLLKVAKGLRLLNESVEIVVGGLNFNYATFGILKNRGSALRRWRAG